MNLGQWYLVIYYEKADALETLYKHVRQRILNIRTYVMLPDKAHT